MWLQLEEPTHRLHYVLVYGFRGEAPAVDSFRERVADRVASFPRLRKRVVPVPLNIARPVLVDEPGFDPARHVESVTLSPPADEEALRSALSAIQTAPLDPDRPRWSLTLVDGFTDDRFVVAAKVHHSYADAVSFAAMVMDLVRDDPSADLPLAPPPSGGLPRRSELVVEALRDSIRVPRRLAEGRGPRALVGDAARGLVTANRAIRAMQPAPRCSLNLGTGGPDRQVHWLRIPTAEIENLSRALRATLNTIVLAVVTGGLRRHLARAGRSDEEEVVVLMPISLRQEGDHAALGNRVTSIFPRVQLREQDPVEQVEHIADEVNRQLKQGKAGGITAAKTLADVAPPAFMRWLIRRTYSRPDFNLMVSTAAFPDDPVACFGAQLEEIMPFPHLPAWHGLAIGVAGYRDTTVVAFTADEARVGSSEELLACTRSALEELREAASGLAGRSRTEHAYSR
jgi:diacylglycerol O-acyltransferase